MQGARTQYRPVSTVLTHHMATIRAVRSYFAAGYFHGQVVRTTCVRLVRSSRIGPAAGTKASARRETNANYENRNMSQSLSLSVSHATFPHSVTSSVCSRQATKHLSARKTRNDLIRGHNPSFPRCSNYCNVSIGICWKRDQISEKTTPFLSPLAYCGCTPTERAPREAPRAM